MNSQKHSVNERSKPAPPYPEIIAQRERGFAPAEPALRALFENAPVGIYMSTIEGKMLCMNASGAAMFGYNSPEKFVIETPDTPKQLFVFPEQRAELVRRALASDDFVRGEVNYRRRDGSLFIAHLYMRAVRDAEGNPLFLEGFVEDITERKRVEAALQESEARYRTLVENAPLPIGMSRNGFAIYVNRKYLEMFRCESAEAQVGRPITDYWAPEYRETIIERGRRRAQGLAVPINIEGIAQRDDGSQFPIQVAVTTVDLPDGAASLAFFTDISDLKQAQAELKQHQEHLEELVEMRTGDLHAALAELEHMSYSMVHDMRAPLRAMQGFARLVLEECPECRRTPGQEYLDRIVETSNRLDHLIRDALGYNRLVRENLQVQAVDVRRLLQGMIRSYPNLQPPVADVTFDATTRMMVLGNESLLTQCFGNLLDNAVKFVAPGVHPHIHIWAKSSTLNNEPSTIIYIADNGIGIPRGAQEKIFRMFQRMHSESAYPGTGIGLAIVKKAVERMGGRVGLESAPGRGSTFWVELPSVTKVETRPPTLCVA